MLMKKSLYENIFGFFYVLDVKKQLIDPGFPLHELTMPHSSIWEKK